MLVVTPPVAADALVRRSTLLAHRAEGIPVQGVTPLFPGDRGELLSPRGFSPHATEVAQGRGRRRTPCLPTRQWPPGHLPRRRRPSGSARHPGWSRQGVWLARARVLPDAQPHASGGTDAAPELRRRHAAPARNLRELPEPPPRDVGASLQATLQVRANQGRAATLRRDRLYGGESDPSRALFRGG